ncbi:MAG: NgoFVII family restriction endonuclease [Bacteroidia bacterium]|nr:MAG: NgoFVII family restriction endonuclease [Bacteroidia bacterium]
MATSTTFLSNTGETHRDYLLNLLEQSDKIIFAVGFLKQSGLNHIKAYLKDFCADKTKSSTFYIGTGLGETDPDTLQSLYNIIKTKSNHQLVLCTPDAGIFHPKIYVFITGRKVTIVTGSSNLTQHGWAVNDEVSMVIETTINSPEFKKLESYFKDLHKRYYTDKVESLIARYKKERDEHGKKYGKGHAFRFRRRKTSIAGIDMPRLRAYYEIYQNSDYYIEPAYREAEYEQAKENLEELASNKRLSAAQFHNLFGPLVGHKDYKPKLWHSGSIHRKTYKTLNNPDAFRDIVRSVKSNLSKQVGIAYENVIVKLNQMRKAKEISGVGENIVAEIFLSYNPEKFANLNDNPLAVLELVGKEFPYISSFKGSDYAEYVALLTEIKNELGMSSFLEIDSFFNYVYWNLIEE